MEEGGGEMELGVRFSINNDESKKKKKKNKHRRPLPVCARRVTWGPFHSEISISREGERFIRSHSSEGPRCLEEPQG